MHIKQTIDKVPGGLMVIPLLLGAIFNTFFPEVLAIGGFTTAMFSRTGALPILGVFLFCMGSQLSFNAAPKALKKGFILTAVKYAVGVFVGIGVGKMFGPAGVLGLTPLAIIAAMTNSNGGLYVALSGEFGDETDVGAVAVLSINDGPFFTMVALGASGFATIPWQAFVAVALPITLGMIMGNLDPEMRKFLAQGEKLMIPFFAFPLGAGITGFAGFAALAIFRERPLCGLAEGSTAGNAVGTPLAIAAADPSLQAIVPVATAQIAASCLVTAFLCPFVVVMVNSFLEKRGHKWARIPKESR